MISMERRRNGLKKNIPITIREIQYLQRKQNFPHPIQSTSVSREINSWDQYIVLQTNGKFRFQSV